MARKDEQNAEDLMVGSVPIFIQRKIKPEAIISDPKQPASGCYLAVDSRRNRGFPRSTVLAVIFGNISGISK
jgi:hypothetical protein